MLLLQIQVFLAVTVVKSDIEGSDIEGSKEAKDLAYIKTAIGNPIINRCPVRCSEYFQDSLRIFPQTYFHVKVYFINILQNNLCHKIPPSLAILALKLSYYNVTTR